MAAVTALQQKEPEPEPAREWTAEPTRRLVRMIHDEVELWPTCVAKRILQALVECLQGVIDNPGNFQGYGHVRALLLGAYAQLEDLWPSSRVSSARRRALQILLDLLEVES